MCQINTFLAQSKTSLLITFTNEGALAFRVEATLAQASQEELFYLLFCISLSANQLPLFCKWH